MRKNWKKSRVDFWACPPENLIYGGNHLYLASLAKKAEARNQYDEFLHKIQQPKMKGIWDNKKDEVWENVYVPSKIKR